MITLFISEKNRRNDNDNDNDKIITKPLINTTSMTWVGIQVKTTILNTKKQQRKRSLKILQTLFFWHIV